MPVTGAVASGLRDLGVGGLSPEAEQAAGAFDGVRPRLPGLLADCASGYAISRGLRSRLDAPQRESIAGLPYETFYLPSKLKRSCLSPFHALARLVVGHQPRTSRSCCAG